MTDRASAEGRIDALRKAIDSAVDGLNEAWGGFGPNEQLERVISDLQRARTNDDIAQGRDWPPVVTDRASAEGLRAALFDCYVLLPPERLDLLRDETKQTIDAAAALRDTGPRPDSDSQHGLEIRGELAPIDLDGIEMRWASQWNQSDDGEVRAWRDDVAALIDEVHRLRHVSNRYFEEMVRRTPDTGPRPDSGIDLRTAVAIVIHRWRHPTKSLEWNECNCDRDAEQAIEVAQDEGLLSTPRTETPR